MNRKQIYAEQVEHQHLCDQARALGVPTSLEDARSPRTITALREAIAKAQA